MTDGPGSPAVATSINLDRIKILVGSHNRIPSLVSSLAPPTQTPISRLFRQKWALSVVHAEERPFPSMSVAGRGAKWRPGWI
jgi:hypothetical protein